MLMDFIPGERLLDIMMFRGGLKPPNARDEVFTDLMLRLDKFHQRGFVHSDSHMGNIMIGKQGDRAWLIDYGLAYELKRLSEAQQLEDRKDAAKIPLQYKSSWFVKRFPALAHLPVYYDGRRRDIARLMDSFSIVPPPRPPVILPPSLLEPPVARFITGARSVSVASDLVHSIKMKEHAAFRDDNEGWQLEYQPEKNRLRLQLDYVSSRWTPEKTRNSTSLVDDLSQRLGLNAPILVASASTLF
jgi:hypothetical protein